VRWEGGIYPAPNMIESISADAGCPKSRASGGRQADRAYRALAGARQDPQTAWSPASNRVLPSRSRIGNMDKSFIIARKWGARVVPRPARLQGGQFLSMSDLTLALIESAY